MRISIIPTTTLNPTMSLMRMGHRTMTTSLSFGRARTRAGTLRPGQSERRHRLYQKSLPGSNRLCDGFAQVPANDRSRRSFNPAIPMSASEPQ